MECAPGTWGAELDCGGELLLLLLLLLMLMALVELMGMLFEVREMGPELAVEEDEFGPEAPVVPAKGSMCVIWIYICVGM
jgi:hypothetical protein